MTFDAFIARLDRARKSGDGYVALCPAHPDKKPSLGVSRTADKILLHCYAGCRAETVVAKMGLTMANLFDDCNSFPTSTNGAKNTISAVYQYVDEQGELLYENVRRTPKAFAHRRPDGHGGYIWKLNGVRRVPYRLPELIAAIDRGVEMVFLCEGEKDADALAALGLTSSNLKDWKPKFNRYIGRSQIVIIPDHDAPGIKLANKTAAIVARDIRSVKFVDLFGSAPLSDDHGKDVSDWIRGCKQDEGLGEDEIATRLIQLVDGAENWEEGENETVNDETKLRPFPKPDDACFAGLAGDFVRLLEPHSEADPMALLIQFLAYFGNIVGRKPHIRVESDHHNTNLFCILVGPTGVGRKGTSFRRVKDVFTGIDDGHDNDCHASGLASGEGLIWRVRDPTPKKATNGRTVLGDPGISDKRLLVVEGEFVQVLRVQGREGNILSGSVRNLWDSGTVENLTKNSPLKTSNAHVSIIAHITQDELLYSLKEIDAANGYANRFLFALVKRRRLLPFGSEISETEVETLRTRITQTVKFAKHVGQMQFTADARRSWAKEYERLETSRVGYLAKITQRASPYVLRLSCIYALLGQSSCIETRHLESALAVWQYAEDSARYIFGEKLGNETAERILNAIRNTPEGISRTAIRNIFDRHITKPQLDSALQFLLENELARCERESTNGKPKEIWIARLMRY
jgi:hypothetical protein